LGQAIETACPAAIVVVPRTDERLTMFEDWEMDGGNIKLFPVTGYSTAVAPMTAMIRIQFARSDDQLQTGATEAVQLGMTAAVARELAAAFLDMADRIDLQPTSSRE
jgi:hypothetical protein